LFLVVPEPSTWILVALATAVLALLARRRKFCAAQAAG